MGEVIDFPVDHDADLAWPVVTDLPTLAADLRLAMDELRETDCPGNVNADVPAMVLTDLAALTLDQWEVGGEELSRDELLAKMCGALAYMFDWFKLNADDLELERLRELTRALDAMSSEDHRPRLGKR